MVTWDSEALEEWAADSADAADLAASDGDSEKTSSMEQQAIMVQIQISSAYTQNVTSILNSSTDVQALFSQGWNVTSIRPIITTTLDGNGNIVTQATSANVILQGTNGRALVVVNLTTDKVTKIVTTTVNNNPT